MSLPSHLHYTSDHEWIQIEGDRATVGITDHAQAELSDVVFVELPEIGKHVATGDPTAVVESVKAASDIYAPLAGEITEVNTTLQDDPALINTAPYTDGWLFQMRLESPEALSHLLSAADYQNLIS